MADSEPFSTFMGNTPVAAQPLAGTENVLVLQGGVAKKVPVSGLPSGGGGGSGNVTGPNSSTDQDLAAFSGTTGKNLVDFSYTTVTSKLNNFTPTLKGVVPGSGGGTSNFLRADATWAPPPGGGFIPAGADLTWYVNAGGNDSNPGTIGSPFATVDHAVSVAAQYDWDFQFAPTIQLGTPGTPVTLTSQPQVNLRELHNIHPLTGGSIVGDKTTPTNVNYVFGGGTAFTGNGTGCIWNVEGFHLTGGGGFHGIHCVNGASIYPGAIIWDCVFSCLYFCGFGGEIAGTNASFGTFYNQLGTFWMLLQEGARINFSFETHTFPSSPVTTVFLGVEENGGNNEVEFDGVAWGNFGNMQGHKLEIQGQVWIQNNFGLMSEIPGTLAGSFFNESTVLQGILGAQHCSHNGPISYPSNLNQQSGAAYTVAPRDLGGTIEMTNAGANTVTLPLTFFGFSNFPASIAGTTMTVSGSGTGNTISVGDVITGTGVAAQTYVTALGSGTGDDGTYTISPSQTLTSRTMFNNRPAPLNGRIVVTQAGAGATTIAGATGVTIRTAAGFSTTLASQWSAATLYQRSFANAAAEWVMVPGA